MCLLRSLRGAVPVLAARGQNPPGVRAAMHPRWPLRFNISLCKDNVTLCQSQYTIGGSGASLCVAPRANSAAIHLSSCLASPAPRRSRRSVGFIHGLFGALVLSGCHTYLPVETPAPGSVARVHVPVRSALADPGLPPATASVEGVVLDSGDTLVLEVRTRRVIGAFNEFMQENTYRVSRDEVVSVEVREFSPGRSAVLGSAILGGAVFLAVAAFRGDTGSGGSKPGPGGGQTFTIPIWGW